MNWQATHASMNQVVRKKLLRLKKNRKRIFHQVDTLHNKS